MTVRRKSTPKRGARAERKTKRGKVATGAADPARDATRATLAEQLEMYAHTKRPSAKAMLLEHSKPSELAAMLRRELLVGLVLRPAPDAPAFEAELLAPVREPNARVRYARDAAAALTMAGMQDVPDKRNFIARRALIAALDAAIDTAAALFEPGPPNTNILSEISDHLVAGVRARILLDVLETCEWNVTAAGVLLKMGGPAGVIREINRHADVARRYQDVRKKKGHRSAHKPPPRTTDSDPVTDT